MNEDGENAAGLAEKLNALIGTADCKAKKVSGLVLFLKGDRGKLEKIAADKKIENISIAYLKEGKDFSPRNQDIARLYKINLEAKNTVIVYKDGMVAANFVNLDANDFAKVEEAVKKLVQ